MEPPSEQVRTLFLRERKAGGPWAAEMAESRQGEDRGLTP
jgi:hypothetical protein